MKNTFVDQFLPVAMKAAIGWRGRGSSDEVHDIAIEAVEKVWKYCEEHNVTDPERISAIVWRTAINVLIMRLRAKSRRSEERLSDFEQKILNAYSFAPETVDDSIIVKALLNGLPERERVVIEMRIMEEMSWEDVCDITGLKINQARYACKVGLAKLREFFEA